MARKVITKEELLNIATKIIEEEGVKACSVRRLSKEAGIGTGTIYNYFPSQKELLQNLFFMSWSDTIANLEPILEMDSTPENKIREFAFKLKKDIVARKGIGKELYGVERFNSDICESHREIFNAIIGLIYKIISEAPINIDKGSEKLEMVSRWILMIIINSIITNEFPLEDVVNEINSRFL